MQAPSPGIQEPHPTSPTTSSTTSSYSSTTTSSSGHGSSILTSATDQSPTSSTSTTSLPDNTTAPSSGSSSSQPANKSKGKGKKGKKTKGGGQDDEVGESNSKKAERRTRVEWNNFPLALLKLQAQLARYQSLDGRKQQKERNELKKQVAADILGDERLRKWFQSQGLTDGIIDEAMHAWYKNHLGKKEGSTKPRIHYNPLWKAMASRRVSPMRLWSSNNMLLVMEKAGPAAKDIGARSHAGAELWRELPAPERETWEKRADEHSKDKEGQCYLNQHVLVAVIVDCLTKLVGHGGQQAGNFAMELNAAFRTQNGDMFYERASVTLNPNCPSFATWKGGYTPQESERWNSWAEEAVLLNPDQSRSVTNLPPGARCLEFTADGRPLLPEYQGGDLQSVLETLEALLVLAWQHAERAGSPDWNVIANSPRDYVTERWVHMFVTPWSQLSLLEALGFWRAILDSQRQGSPFRFYGLSGTRKISVSVKNTPTKGYSQKQKAPLPLHLVFNDDLSLNVGGQSPGSQATTPTTPMLQSKGPLRTHLTLSDIDEDQNEMEAAEHFPQVPFTNFSTENINTCQYDFPHTPNAHTGTTGTAHTLQNHANLNVSSPSANAGANAPYDVQHTPSSNMSSPSANAGVNTPYDFQHTPSSNGNAPPANAGVNMPYDFQHGADANTSSPPANAGANTPYDFQHTPSSNVSSPSANAGANTPYNFLHTVNASTPYGFQHPANLHSSQDINGVGLTPSSGGAPFLLNLPWNGIMDANFTTEGSAMMFPMNSLPSASTIDINRQPYWPMSHVFPPQPYAPQMNASMAQFLSHGLLPQINGMPPAAHPVPSNTPSPSNTSSGQSNTASDPIAPSGEQTTAAENLKKRKLKSTGMAPVRQSARLSALANHQGSVATHAPADTEGEVERPAKRGRKKVHTETSREEGAVSNGEQGGTLSRNGKSQGGGGTRGKGRGRRAA